MEFSEKIWNLCEKRRLAYVSTLFYDFRSLNFTKSIFQHSFSLFSVYLNVADFLNYVLEISINVLIVLTILNLLKIELESGLT